MKKPVQVLSLCSAIMMFSASPPPLTAQTFSEWSAPVNLGATINASANDV